MRTQSATLEPCLSPSRPARRDFLAGLAGVTAAAGVVVAAVASPEPDAALLAAVCELNAATAEVDRLAAIWSAADDRAEAAYPPPLPSFNEWAAANHPRGAFLQEGNPNSAGRAAMARLLRRVPGGAAGIDWEGPAGERFADEMVQAERAHYVQVRPVYDALVVEHQAARQAIDEAEGAVAADKAVAAAERRQGEAVAALIACRPKTASGFVQKAAALLGHLDSGDFEVAGEMAAIVADAKALIAGGVA